jgi:hypothetical protein
MIQYGFQRLALLNSAGYRRAELPLDAAVSMIAPNNTGKTSLINALQFLLIIDKRRMDFGAHDVDTSRRFYFPHNSAYILLEVALPTAGTVVLGCVGKGVSHDYEYFAYKGQLQLEDYRLADGTQIQQPQLKAHMAGLGKLVFSYTATEFAAGLYGSRRKLLDEEPDITVFKLEHPAHATAFQRVLTRTLRLDKLRSNEVKDYLLTIFQRDLPDSDIDFKAEWDKAFSEVNADRAQYLATLQQQSIIESMDKKHSRRLELRGKLLHLRPLIDQRLNQWEAHFASQGETLRAAITDVEQQQSGLQLEDRRLNERQGDIKREQQRLSEQEKRHAILDNEFALIADRAMLDDGLATERYALARQTTLVMNASSRGVDAISRDKASAERERNQLQRELSTIADNMYLQLKSVLPPKQLAALNLVLNQQTMTMASQDFTLTSATLSRWLEAITDQADTFALPGLRLSTDGLIPQHTQRSREEIDQRIQELDHQLDNLTLQMATARNLESASAEKARLDKSVRDFEIQIERFDELQSLKLTQIDRRARLEAILLQLAALENHLQRSVDAAKSLREQERAWQAKLDTLISDHAKIIELREDRRDDSAVFSELVDLPHQPWVGSLDVTLEHLAVALAAYHRDCEELLRLDRDIEGKLTQLHAGGLTKFQFASGNEVEIQRIIEFAAHLAQEDQAIERKARTAVVNVTACLRELRDGLSTFKNKMREFNRLISRRQLSDLSVFKIEPVDQRELVEAIEQLISTAELTESNDTFELFNHDSLLDDATLNRAKSLLIHEGEVRGCLRVEHFFRLEFVVGKAGRKEESFADMDSAASNGTVLMAKLITGLALLHLMQDKRYKVQAVCYLDEASSLDQRNQLSLIEMAQDFGYALIFASPTPLVTARYCVPITNHDGYNNISRKSWQILEPLDQPESISDRPSLTTLNPSDAEPAQI